MEENKINFISFQILINRLKEIFSKEKDIDIAKYLNLKYESFAQMKRRNTMPYENILFLCRQQKISIFKLLNIDNRKFDKYVNKLKYKQLNRSKFKNNNELIIKIKIGKKIYICER